MKKLIMKVSTFLVFAYFCTLFIIKIIKEAMILSQKFGSTVITIKGYECLSILSLIGIIVTALLVVKVVKWIFSDKEEKSLVEDKKEKKEESLGMGQA